MAWSAPQTFELTGSDRRQERAPSYDTVVGRGPRRLRRWGARKGGRHEDDEPVGRTSPQGSQWPRDGESVLSASCVRRASSTGSGETLDLHQAPCGWICAKCGPELWAPPIRSGRAGVMNANRLRQFPTTAAGGPAWRSRRIAPGGGDGGRGDRRVGSHQSCRAAVPHGLTDLYLES
jgi:hypothetical protein